MKRRIAFQLMRNVAMDVCVDVRASLNCGQIIATLHMVEILHKYVYNANMTEAECLAHFIRDY